MYEERRGLSFWDILVQLLLVVVFVVIMIWLFPTKGFLANTYATKDDVNTAIDTKLEAIYGRMYADNIETMKDAATGYFTTSRLPSKVGDSVTLTLDEMLAKKLVLNFKDSNGQACDVDKSYVKITKMDNEYEMKVQLSCSDYSDYVIVYMGCYDYCDSDICQAKTTVTTTKSTTVVKPTPVSTKHYEYEYRLITQNVYSAWGNWSGWSTTAINSDSLTQVEMNKYQVLQGYNQVYGVVDYIPNTTYTTTTTNGTTSTIAATATTGSSYYTDWVYQGYTTSTYALSTSVSDSSTTKYVYVSYKTTVDCSNICKNVTTYTYQKYTRTYVAGGTNYSCPSGYTLSGTNCTKSTSGTTTQVPVYGYTPVYGWVNGTPIYTTITNYRYRTRTLTSTASTVYKWSSSSSDSTLTNAGYVLTGSQREV